MTWLTSSLYMETFVVQGPNIIELEIEPLAQAFVPATTVEERFDDPAILSYGRPATRDVRPSSNSQPSGQLPSAPPSVCSEADTGAPSITPSAVSSKPAIPTKTKPQGPSSWIEPNRECNDNSATATLTGPFNELALDTDFGFEVVVDYEDCNGKLDGEDEASLEQALPLLQTPIERAGKRTKRGRRGRGAKGVATSPDRTQSHQSLHLDAVSRPLLRVPTTGSAPNGGAGKRNKGTGSNGWRQTPFVEDALRGNVVSSNISNRSARRAQGALATAKGRYLDKTTIEEQKGWATEDPTDIQDMGDFDFIGNLSKFDKREVFDRIRQGDATADEERLVSFNRLPRRSGTAAGKNLHHTENVLSPKFEDTVDWNSEAGDSEEETREARTSSGRSSRRNMSCASLKKLPSRKGSAMVGEQQRTGPGLQAEPVGGIAHSPHHSGANPVLKSFQLSKTLDDSPKSSFHLVPSGHRCPCLSPLQMLELEQLAISEFGLFEDMVTENASRSIAETARKVITANVNHEGGGPDRNGRNVSPLVVILAGNNKTGARAIAGGRQLRNHGTRVVVCVLGSEGEEDLLDSVRRQLSIYRKFGGQVTSSDELWKTLKYVNAPAELIIDALLGMYTSFDDLRSVDQAVFRELLNWINGGAIDVLSIDVPSGLDASSGKNPYVKYNSLAERGASGLTDSFIHPTYIISLGAPKTGLLTAISRDIAYERWKLFVTDIGISNLAWRKFGARRKHGVEFGSEWVTEIRYQANLQ